MISQSLAQEVSLLEANLCSALADPTRILILYALNEKPLSVTEILNELSIPQSMASRHLKVLRDSGLVNTHRRGSSIIYRLTDKQVIQALDLLRGVMRTSIQRQATLMKELVTPVYVK